MMFVEITSWVFIFTGALLGIAGGIGIHRFPDFYTRLHAKADEESTHTHGVGDADSMQSCIKIRESMYTDSAGDAE